MRDLQHFLETYPGDEAKAVLAFMDANRFESPLEIARQLDPPEFQKLGDVAARVVERLRSAPCVRS